MQSREDRHTIWHVIVIHRVLIPRVSTKESKFIHGKGRIGSSIIVVEWIIVGIVVEVRVHVMKVEI